MRWLQFVVALLVGLTGLIPVSPSFAQASFSESFDNTGPTTSGSAGPSNLISAGWIFRNQSQPRGTSSWYGSGSTQAFEPHSGTGFLAADFNSTQLGSGAAISNWAILPAISDQAAGDMLRFVVQASIYSGRKDRLQVRYASNGSTNTGSSASDVGDFTTLLLDIDPVPTGKGWIAQSVALPGTGRIAFRYYLPVADTSAGTGGFFGIDSLAIGTPPAGLFPQPGQTVTWTQAMSPIVIDGNQIIPAGGTVVVEPGVTIQLQANASLKVQGTLRGQGTDQSRIMVTAPTVYPPALEVFGTLDLTYATIGGQVRASDGGTLRFADTTFQSYGTVTSTTPTVNYRPPYLQFDRCHFEAVDLYVSNVTTVLRDSTFHDASPIFLYAYLLLKNVSVDGGTLSVSKDYQPGYIDQVTVRNSPNAGISLGGGNWGNDYFIGSNVVLQNNKYPVAVGDGGLLPGSNVPATGNLNNYIPGPGDGDHRGPITWANVGIPYVITGRPTLGGSWKLLPGTTIKLGPSAGIYDDLEAMEARGREGLPVRFERLDPLQAWDRIETPGRLEHAIVDGSELGVVYGSLNPARYVDSSVFRNNGRAVIGQAIIRSSQFIANGTGAYVGTATDLDGATNPNSFTGNQLAVSNASDATDNWWGSADGPRVDDNPRGTGDPINSGIPYKPFRATAPDYSDSPPFVQLREPAFLAEPGQKIMLNWDAQDDGTIASQRIVFAPAGRNPQDYTVIADQLPAAQRAFEWTVPSIGFSVNNMPASIRIIAIDDQGQEGWDDAEFQIPSGEATGTLTLTSNLAGPYKPGDHVPICWTASDIGPYADMIEAYLFLDGDRRIMPLGGVHSGLNCLALDLEMPFVSTDSARVGIKLYGTANRVKWFFSNNFTIRPDPRVGDLPPTVSLLTPAAGTSIVPGSVVPITWTASDDEAVRSIDIHASYDGGRIWHVVVEGLPGTTTRYDWQTAPGSGFGNLKLRVVAKDLRFQNSSATSGSGGSSPAPTATPTATSTPTPVPPTPTTPPPTATPTVTATPVPDTVTIQRAEYTVSRKQLRVEATSSQSTATLNVYTTTTNQLIGKLGSTRNGRYSGTFTWPSNPGQITVRSTLGGAATRTVTTK